MMMKSVVGLVALGMMVSAVSACSIQGDADAHVSVSGPVVGTYAPLMTATPPPYESHCSPAPALMPHAVCVCRDLSITGSLRTIAKPGIPADVGVGGDVHLASGTFVDGSLRSSGEVSFAGDLEVAHHLWANGGVSAAGSLVTGGDLASGRGLDGAGDLTVRGRLRVAGEDDWTGSHEIGGRGSYEAPATIDPCGCSAPAIYDVARAVAIARDDNDNDNDNDNTALHLAGNGIDTTGSSEMTLTTGRYYVKSLSSVGDVRVRIEGDVQLYVDGDLETVGEGNFTIAKNGSLDLFVAGSVHTVGNVSLGDPSRPDAFRLYVGGHDGQRSSISLVGSQSWSGLIYAPTSDVTLTGDTEVHGAIYAGSLDKAGSLVVRAARATSLGERCEARPVVN